jgi:hypothetical protein
MWYVLAIALVIIGVSALVYSRWVKAKTAEELKRYQAEQSYTFDEANVTGFHKKLERFGRQ